MASIKKNTFYVIVSRILSTVLGFIASIYLIRLLGTEGNGIFSKINALTNYLQWLYFLSPEVYFYPGLFLLSFTWQIIKAYYYPKRTKVSFLLYISVFS